MKIRSPVPFDAGYRRLLGRPLIAIGFGAVLAAAQAPAAPSEYERNTIIVDGERLSPEAVRQRASEFVRQTGVAAGATPAARWVDPVCPEVLGLEEVGKRAAEAKIRKIAAAAGIEVAAEPCERNIVVSFTADGGALAREIQKREGWRLSQLSPSARTEVLEGSAPIRWFYTSEVRARHGGRGAQPGNSGAHAVSGVGYGAGSSMGGSDMPALMHYESSIVSTLTTRALTSAVVIIDQDDVMGRRLDTVAAYAALVALAEIRAADAKPQGSILNLFDSPSAPRDLTSQDMAFLRALYRLPLDRRAMQHRSALVHQIAGALNAEN